MTEKKKTPFKPIVSADEKKLKKAESERKRKKRNADIDFHIARIEKICMQCWANKTALNRYKFSEYSEVLKKVKFLSAQKQKNSKEFNILFKKLASFE